MKTAIRTGPLTVKCRIAKPAPNSKPMRAIQFHASPPTPASWALGLATAFCLLIPSARGATLVVTNLATIGPGTLRQALADNFNLGGGHTVVFSNLTGTITLAAELTVNAPVTIRGPGTNVLAVSGNNLFRVFTVIGGPTLISDLTIRDGRVTGTPGQGRQQDGADGQGGGIHNLNSALTISNCLVLSNSVVGGVGAERQNAVVGRGGKGMGGGIHNEGGVLRLINTSLGGNQAQGGTGGGANNGNAGEGGDALGGAIYTLTGTNQVIACNLADNVARGGEGGSSGGNGSGGFGGNGQGAGIYNQSVGIIWKSTLHHGSAVGGVGGTGNTTGANGSGYGGGIYVVSELALQSSTIASNSASGSATDWGGGLFNASTDFLNITNSTIAGNQADAGGGLYGSANLANTILAANTAGTAPDVQGTITSLDYNLIQNAAGATLLGATDHVIVGSDPLLGPLQDNGGPMPTMALLPGSPALDQGKSFGLPTDQRGAPRLFDFASIANAGDGDGSDIGAFELSLPALSIARSGANSVLSWSTLGAGFRLQSVTNLATSNNWITVRLKRLAAG